MTPPIVDPTSTNVTAEHAPVGAGDVMPPRSVNRRAQVVGIWCGPVAAALILLGACVLARWVPPWVHPGDSAEKVARVFTQHADRIRFGTFVACVGFTLLAPWGVVVAGQVRRGEGRSPVLSQLLVVCVAVATVFVVITCCIWGTAVFRPADTDPDVTRALNDLAWIVFLFSAPPFTLWAATLSYAILAEPEAPVYPRWLGYLSAWAALLIMPAGLIIFFKRGPFDYAGLVALYVPFAVFMAWLVAVTRCTLVNLKAGCHD